MTIKRRVSKLEQQEQEKPNTEDTKWERYWRDLNKVYGSGDDPGDPPRNLTQIMLQVLDGTYHPKGSEDEPDRKAN